MVAVSIPTFGGMVPALDDRKLPDTAAAYSENVDLYGGTLKSLRKPRYMRDVAVGVTKSYRIPDGYANAFQIYGDSHWLDFQNSETDVVRAPVFGDVWDRYYWASSSAEPRYNTKARIISSSPAWYLGIPAPVAAPGLAVIGGAGAVIARAYVYTYVSEYGEEGPPSAPTLVTGFVNGSWNLTITAADPLDRGVDRNIKTYRIYRTITSSAGVATYFLVTELTHPTVAYNDTLTDIVVSGKAQLESFSWTAPPQDLQGFMEMPNGIIAAWRENELWFSEAYRPHAWPAAYVLTVPYPVIGFGIAGQTLVICTSAYPMTASGVSPAYITTTTLTTFEPCTARGSIMSAPEGVYYASNTGLVLVNPGQASNVTRELITVDRWSDLTPIQFKAARLGQAYYGFGALAGGVFDDDGFDTDDAFVAEDPSGTQKGVLIDPRDVRVAFNLLKPFGPILGVMNDVWSSELMLISDDKLWWIDSRQQDPIYEVLKWRSKKFKAQDRKNFGACKIDFTVPNTTLTQNPVRNNTLVQDLAADQYGLFRVYADERLVLTWEMRTSGELIRLPSGFKAEFWQLEIECRVNVSNLHMASTVKELSNV